MRFSRLAIEGGDPIRKTPWPKMQRSDEATRSRLLEALNSENWSDGPQVRSFEQAFAEFLGCNHALLTVNATMALKLALIAFNIEPGDEVLVPALTFPSVVSSILECGAVPVVCDVDSNNYCMSAATIMPAIGPRTRVILPTHLYCSQCDMPPIVELAKHYSLTVIEDCAHAPGAQRHGRCAGTWGQAAIFSFNQKKPLSCGEGGCLASNSADLVQLARRLRDFDTAASVPPKRMQRMGKVSEFQGAVLCGQLTSLSERLRIAEERAEALRERLEKLHGIYVLDRLAGTNLQTYYNFCFRIPHLGDAPAFRQALSAELGLQIGTSYMPLDANPALDCSSELQFRTNALRNGGRACSVAFNAYRNEAMRFSGKYLLDDRGVSDIAAAVEKVMPHFISCD